MWIYEHVNSESKGATNKLHVLSASRWYKADRQKNNQEWKYGFIRPFWFGRQKWADQRFRAICSIYIRCDSADNKTLPGGCPAFDADF